MEKAERKPVVPLEAGIGPDNPPCPACGEPLFGWIDARRGLPGPVRRCESCGLGVAGEAGDAEAALAALDRRRSGQDLTIPNRDGFAAWVGGAGWAGLEPGARYLFTPEAVRRLLAHRDQVVTSARWSPAKGVAAMWQTLINSATFGHNLVVGTPVKSIKNWKARIDWLVVAALAIPAFVVALALEPVSAIFRRGSVSSLEIVSLQRAP